jgi:hypothetical protein
MRERVGTRRPSERELEAALCEMTSVRHAGGVDKRHVGIGPQEIERVVWPPRFEIIERKGNEGFW